MAWFLGFDTSNYKTSVALYDSRSGQAVGRGRFLETPAGALGLRQSEALFQHIRQLGRETEALFAQAGERRPIAAAGYSARPRDAEGSYMPCFLAGQAAAQVCAAALGVPAFAFSHQQGHIASALWSVGRLDWLEKPFLSWHLSGGTTELLLAEPCGETRCKVRRIGGATDLAAGQIIDRAGVRLGLPFPCGAELDKLARQGTGEVRPFVPKSRGLEFSLSGLENKFEELLGRGTPPAEVAAFAVESVVKTVERITERALAQYPLPLLFSGGVTASSQMQRAFAGRPGIVFAAPGYNGDNAVGAAVLAALEKGEPD